MSAICIKVEKHSLVRVIMSFRCLLLVLFLSGCDSTSDSEFVNITDTSHSLEEKPKGTSLVAGGYTPVDHWIGQWRVVNVWAEWCKPCWQEIVELNTFNTLQKNMDVKLLGFNFDELEPSELLELKQKMSIHFPVLTVWPDRWQKPEIKGLPATIIIAPDDSVQDVLWGPQTSESLQAAIQALR